MEPQQLKELIFKELPTLIQQDSSLREWVLTIGRTQFAEPAATKSRFDQSKLFIAEIKSSMSRGEVYLFERKARFYEKRYQRMAQRLMVI